VFLNGTGCLFVLLYPYEKILALFVCFYPRGLGSSRPSGGGSKTSQPPAPSMALAEGALLYFQESKGYRNNSMYPFKESSSKKAFL